LRARLKLFAHWTFRTLKLRTNANPANGCIDRWQAIHRMPLR
jgi:hypothetical protein